MTPKNPFTPAFGSEPMILAGRDNILEDVLGGLQNGPGDPNRATILVGPRGSGKTVLLTRIADEASKMGWVTARVTASEGMLGSIVEQTIKNSKGFLPMKVKARLTELHAFGVGFSVDAPKEKMPSWRLQMTEILESFDKFQAGLLITVDEIDTKLEEMVALVRDFQHFVTEKREIALLMAGLPGKTLQMFQDKSISFVRRAFQHRLDSIPLTDVKMAIQKTVEASGRTIDDDALNVATTFTNGFPFLIQLIGYHMWRQSPEAKRISLSDVKNGMESADEHMERMILDTTIRELSDKDIAFLLAMTGDPDISRISDIIKRLNVSASIAGQYRLRLIRQGIIEEYGRGKVRFVMPLLREYLKKSRK